MPALPQFDCLLRHNLELIQNACSLISDAGMNLELTADVF